MKIILVRHGKPHKSENDRLNSAGFAKWVKNYNHSRVAIDSRADACSLEEYNTFYVVSSDLPRAIHSCQIAYGRDPDFISESLREMDIPRFKLPFTLRAWTWVYLSRLLWMLGKKGNFETYSEAKLRAENAARKLEVLANKQQNIVVFSHGYLILHMRRFLKSFGWKQLNKSNKYWGVSVFEIDKRSQ